MCYEGVPQFGVGGCFPILRTEVEQQVLSLEPTGGFHSLVLDQPALSDRNSSEVGTWSCKILLALFHSGFVRPFGPVMRETATFGEGKRRDP